MLEIKHLARVDFKKTHEEMLAYTLARNSTTVDQIWLLEHHAVYTQGTSCNSLPRGMTEKIPVVKTDRGGQITYHGPGQLVVYLLLDIKRMEWGPKRLVKQLEAALINCLAQIGIKAERKSGAPGVYVSGRKIAALGLRIKRGCCFHGMSLNVDMDLSPFDLIDPCGYAGLEVTQIADYLDKPSMEEIKKVLLTHLRAEIQA